MDKTIKPLVISYSYLKEKTPTGQIQRVFWEYLFHQGFQPTIICTKISGEGQVKEKLNSTIIPTYEGVFLNQAFRLLKHSIFHDIDKNPDIQYFSWAKISALRRAKQEALSGKYNYIHSINHPISSHLIALEVKKTTGLPWIASFYDPWYKNPLRPIKSVCISEKDRRKESIVAQYADAIIHTNQAIYDEWVERYGESIKEKMYVLPLVFNLPKRVNDSNMKDIKDIKKFNISHIGTLYLDRTSVDFLKAVRLMLDNHPELKDKFIINYVGTITPEDKVYIKDNGLSSMVNLAGFLSESECNRYYEQSDLFLAIDAKTARNIFFPSKIMKYFYYGKPVLGITPQNSALYYELERSKNTSYCNTDYQSIANFLYRTITDKNSFSGNDKDYWKNFTMEEVFPSYLNIVKTILK